MNHTQTENVDEEDEYDGATSGKIPPINPSYLLKGMALSARISGYILGPLLILGGLGYWIQKHFNTSRIVLFAFIIIAFFISNALIFIRAKNDAEHFVEKSKDADKK
ncbi:MAG: hypothetical protein AUJ34_01930 [Parcubacteria group bacterium CG1_02_41_12]|nr:MAG: hypothetical protein AUJ34_01930 [Parcubacteria group bacterium CG1_02_41_12]PIP67016.1 MAG: hypothetical protein COW93_02475 [Parcubacteria group bacterium CG22_combo_CG10-13_8_21_14_all_41_9]PIZ81600.1 MAG: hypothetical protein COY02_01145 [Parcubacteria group bacterium CG_4_10_14_0_2_um_filter_41_6]